jgi:hypothetical protein
MLKNVLISVVTAAIVAVVAAVLVVSAPSEKFGSFIETVKITFGQGFDAKANSSITGNLTVSGTLTAGGGSAFKIPSFGSCTPTFSSADMIASSTAVGICSISDVLTTDTIIATRHRSVVLGDSYSGFPVKGILATTTGKLGIIITNETGAATTSINSLYRKIDYLILR